METLSVTCPNDGAKFVVVEPESHENKDHFTITCPECTRQFPVVYPNLEDSTENASGSRSPQTKPYEKYYADVIEWTQREGDEAPQPYSGSERTVPIEQYVTAEIEGLGGTRGWEFEKGFDPEDAETLEPAALKVFEPDTFKIWYTPDYEDENGNLAYVVRASLETGVKTKNVYRRETPHDEVLHVKNRGVPRNSDKQWTYLDKNECLARARQAQMSDHVIQDPTSDKPNRYCIDLNADLQPLVNAEGVLATDLVTELARMLVAFQTKRLD